MAWGQMDCVRITKDQGVARRQSAVRVTVYLAWRGSNLVQYMDFLTNYKGSAQIAQSDTAWRLKAVVTKILTNSIMLVLEDEAGNALDIEKFNAVTMFNSALH